MFANQSVIGNDTVYNIKLEITNENNCSNSITKQDTVFARIAANFNIDQKGICANGELFVNVTFKGSHPDVTSTEKSTSTLGKTTKDVVVLSLHCGLWFVVTILILMVSFCVNGFVNDLLTFAALSSIPVALPSLYVQYVCFTPIVELL